MLAANCTNNLIRSTQTIKICSRKAFKLLTLWCLWRCLLMGIQLCFIANEGLGSDCLRNDGKTLWFKFCFRFNPRSNSSNPSKLFKQKPFWICYRQTYLKKFLRFSKKNRNLFTIIQISHTKEHEISIQISS